MILAGSDQASDQTEIPEGSRPYGIDANTVFFSVVYAVLLRSAAFDQALQ